MNVWETRFIEWRLLICAFVNVYVHLLKTKNKRKLTVSYYLILLSNLCFPEQILSKSSWDSTLPLKIQKAILATNRALIRVMPAQKRYTGKKRTAYETKCNLHRYMGYNCSFFFLF